MAVPSDSRVRFIMDSMASYVVADGCAFEQAVMTAQAANPEFAFLFDLRCPEHAYYRWRLFSLASGDSLKSWRVEPFLMVEGGPRCCSSLPSQLWLANSNASCAVRNISVVRRYLPHIRRLLTEHDSSASSDLLQHSLQSQPAHLASIGGHAHVLRRIA